MAEIKLEEVIEHELRGWLSDYMDKLPATGKISRRIASTARGPADQYALTLSHLGNVLYMLADLHPDDRCDALDNALLFYNEAASNQKVMPSDHGYQRLVDDSQIAMLRDELDLWRSSSPKVQAAGLD